MTALAAGYYVGGRVGDTPRAFPLLLAALILSSVHVLLVPALGTSVLPGFRRYGPAWGAVAASGVLLGPPSLLLAVVSPIVVRLTASERIATAAGRVYAVSTLGSIGGTFFTAFWALPALGTRLSHYAAGGLLVLAVVGLGVLRRRPAYALAAGLPLLAAAPARQPAAGRVLYRGESLHNTIEVVDGPDARALYLNYRDAPQTVMPRDGSLTGSYYDYFLLGPLLSGGRRVLVLGVAGGTSLKQLVSAYPDVEVVGVDLDPEVIDVARRFFGLGELPRLRLVAEDARWYLESTRERYDVIAIDLYVTGHIPFFTTTREFFALVRERLSERGIMMMNVLSQRPGDDLIGPFVRTVRSVFPSAFLIDHGNYIVVASREPLAERRARAALESGWAPPVVRRVAERAVATFRTARAGDEWPIFTDDRNDVELRTFRMLHGD